MYGKRDFLERVADMAEKRMRETLEILITRLFNKSKFTVAGSYRKFIGEIQGRWAGNWGDDKTIKQNWLVSGKI